MFITAFVLISAVAVSAPPPVEAAKPAAKTAAKADPKVTEADRPALNAMLKALDKIEARARQRFERREMTKRELKKLRDLTKELSKVSGGTGDECDPECVAGKNCCDGVCTTNKCEGEKYPN